MKVINHTTIVDSALKLEARKVRDGRLDVRIVALIKSGRTAREIALQCNTTVSYVRKVSRRKSLVINPRRDITKRYFVNIYKILGEQFVGPRYATREQAERFRGENCVALVVIGIKKHRLPLGV